MACLVKEGHQEWKVGLGWSLAQGRAGHRGFPGSGLGKHPGEDYALAHVMVQRPGGSWGQMPTGTVMR